MPKVRGSSAGVDRSIFWLGAGASLPAGLPLGRDLLPVVREWLDMLNSRRKNPPEYLLANQYGMALRAIENAPPGYDIEELLSTLGDPFWGAYVLLPKLQIYAADAIRALRFAVALAIKEAVQHGHVPQVLEEFYSEVVRPGDVVITTNYDDISEVLLGGKGATHWERLAHSSAPSGEVVLPDERVLVLHLHGSYLNFVCSRGHEQDSIQLRRDADPLQRRLGGWRDLESLASLSHACQVDSDPERGRCGAPLTPTLIPPMAAKGSFSPSVKRAWATAYRLPAAFRRIAIVGWSASQADLEARLLLRVLISRNVRSETVVVNRSGAVSQGLASLLRSVPYRLVGGGIERFRRHLTGPG